MFTLYLIGGAITFLFMLVILFQGNGDNKEVKREAKRIKDYGNPDIVNIPFSEAPQPISSRRYNF